MGSLLFLTSKKDQAVGKVLSTTAVWQQNAHIAVLRGNIAFVLSFFENFGHNIFLTKIVSLILHL